MPDPDVLQPDVLEKMRSDWNQRAQEDAHYFVAFGRRDQDDEEFFASAVDVVRGLEAELPRLADARPRARRALEIGCGPGRLMKPLSRHFGEIHGVDVSDRMIELAARNLRDVPHAHVRHTNGAELAPFADDSFDFVYSYAVFQHIPSADVIFAYLREARRVLKTGGILRCQLNGLPKTAARYTTWSGARISAEEVRAFTRENDFQLLALDGLLTQYMWTTWRKQPSGWQPAPDSVKAHEPARLRGVTNAQTGESVAPCAGRFASLSLWMDRLPQDCDLNRLQARVEGRAATLTYIGPLLWDGVTQVNLLLPEGTRTGLVPIELEWLGAPLCERVWVRVIPPGPVVPHLISVQDGINLMSGKRVSSGAVKVVLEDVAEPGGLCATVDGREVSGLDRFCIVPLTQSYEVNFRLPRGLAPGPHRIEMTFGRGRRASAEIEVA